jgi:hypothetical protein
MPGNALPGLLGWNNGSALIVGRDAHGAISCNIRKITAAMKKPLGLFPVPSTIPVLLRKQHLRFRTVPGP